MIRRFALACLVLTLAACTQGPQLTPFPPATPTPRPAVPIPPAPPRGEPAEYLGLAPTKLRGLLGTPQFVRRDGVTEMWRYDGVQCRAFFFLYGDNAAQAVRHVETLPAGTTSAADPLCLAALRNARRTS